MAVAFRSATEAGTGSAATSLAINVPSGVQDDDLLILVGVTADGDDGAFNTLSGWNELRNIFETGGSAPSPPGGALWWRIASSEPASYTITPAAGSTGICAKMAAFTGADTTTPMDVTDTIATGDSTNANPATINSGSGTDGFGVFVAAFWDSTTTVWSAAPTNYTDADGLGSVTGNGGGNGCTCAIAYKTANVDPAAAEDPGTFSSSTEQWGAMTVAIRPAPAGITSVTPDEFDMDNADIDVASADVFDASGNDVYLSDVDTLAGSANEVDISSAINTEAVGLINLDLTQLSAGELDDLHTLGPSATRYIIVDATGGEYSFPVILHRPQAIQMVLGAATPGSTTARLTGMSGTFGGGRIEETAAQNPSTTTTNVAADGHREDVWSMEVKDLAREVTYDFRVRYGADLADTVTTTPQLTVSAGAEVALTGVSGTSAVGTVDKTNDQDLTGEEGTSAVGSVDVETSVDISGVFGTSAVGSLGFAESGSVSLTTVVGTSAVGDILQSRTVGLTGVEGTSDVGTVSPGISKALTGEEATSAVGSVGFAKSGSVPLTGVSGTSAVGSVGFTESGNVGITGVEGVSAVGNVGFSVGATVAITGVAGTSDVGTLDKTNDVPLTGTPSVGAVGSVVAENQIDLTGEEATSAVGSVVQSASTELTGVSGTGAVGNLSFTESGLVGLTGVEGTSAVGTMTASAGATVALTGVNGTGAVGTLDKTLVVSITGTASVAALGSVTSGNQTDLSGEESTSAVGSVTQSSSIDLFGVSGTSAVNDISLFSSVGLTGEEVTSAVGTITAVVGSGAALSGVSATGFVGSVSLSGVGFDYFYAQRSSGKWHRASTNV